MINIDGANMHESQSGEIFSEFPEQWVNIIDSADTLMLNGEVSWRWNHTAAVISKGKYDKADSTVIYNLDSAGREAINLILLSHVDIFAPSFEALDDACNAEYLKGKSSETPPKVIFAYGGPTSGKTTHC